MAAAAEAAAEGADESLAAAAPALAPQLSLTAMGVGGGDPGAPLTGGSAHFAYSRVPRDRVWTFIFAAAWLAAIAAGIYGVQHRNPAILHLDDPAVCPLGGGGDAGHRALLQALAEAHAGEFTLGEFARLAGRWLAVSAAAALALGLVFVRLFQHHSRTLTLATVYSQVLMPALVAGGLLANGQLGAAALFGGLALLTAWVFSLWREQIALATRLLGVSAHGLAANGGIITATVLLNLASLVAIAPLGVLLGEPMLARGGWEAVVLALVAAAQLLGC